MQLVSCNCKPKSTRSGIRYIKHRTQIDSLAYYALDPRRAMLLLVHKAGRELNKIINKITNTTATTIINKALLISNTQIKNYQRTGSNRGPFACKANVITNYTTLTAKNINFFKPLCSKSISWRVHHGCSNIPCNKIPTLLLRVIPRKTTSPTFPLTNLIGWSWNAPARRIACAIICLPP